MVGCGNAIDPEVRGDAIDAKLRQDIVAEIFAERIFLRKMAEVLHEDSTLELFFLIRTPLGCRKYRRGQSSVSMSHFCLEESEAEHDRTKNLLTPDSTRVDRPRYKVCRLGLSIVPYKRSVVLVSEVSRDRPPDRPWQLVLCSCRNGFLFLPDDNPLLNAATRLQGELDR